MFKKLLVGLLITIPMVAQAEWLQVDKNDEFISYIDPARTVTTNESLKYAEAWLKLVIHNDIKQDGLAVGDYRLVKYKYRCNSSEASLMAVHSYKKSGDHIDSETFKYDEFKSVIPDSMGEFYYEAVCGYLFHPE